MLWRQSPEGGIRHALHATKSSVASNFIYLVLFVQALRMILQLGVKPSWFDANGTFINKKPHQIPGDLRSYMIETPPVGDLAVLEMLLKVLEPYRQEGTSV